ncbi:hypothetical protein C5C82_03260, partial [Rathayibacter sp. AY1D5]
CYGLGLDEHLALRRLELAAVLMAARRGAGVRGSRAGMHRRRVRSLFVTRRRGMRSGWRSDRCRTGATGEGCAIVGRGRSPRRSGNDTQETTAWRTPR